MMKRILTSGIFAVLLAMMVLLTGCTGNTPPSSESDRTTVDDSAPESITTADTSLEPATSEDTAPLPSTDPVTEETTAIPEVPEISAVISFDGRSERKLKRTFAYENATELSMQTDEEGHSYITLTSTEANINPYILFNYTNFSKYFKADDIDVSQFPYVIIKMKCENITNGSFNLFYYCNSDSTIEATRMTNATYDNGNTDWQYILFDMSERVNWEGNLNGFRLDWCAGSAAAGESVSIAEIKLVQSDESYYKMFDLDRNSVGFPISDEAKQQAQELLGSVNMPSTAFDSYKPLTARHEDPTLQMWFDHMY
ncbi:MAG: hypothetical protein IJX72_04825, partial [Clostridia bacterium]|nr:hypothetical protein [Clostridia bacterium]